MLAVLLHSVVGRRLISGVTGGHGRIGPAPGCHQCASVAPWVARSCAIPIRQTVAAVPRSETNSFGSGFARVEKCGPLSPNTACRGWASAGRIRFRAATAEPSLFPPGCLAVTDVQPPRPVLHADKRHPQIRLPTWLRRSSPAIRRCGSGSMYGRGKQQEL